MLGELQTSFEAQRIRLQADAGGVVPEEVLVLETVGSVERLLRATQKIDGMEWLAEIEEEDIPPNDDFFAVDKRGRRKPEATLDGRLFLIFTNQRALTELLRLWDLWRRGQGLPRGLTPWRDVFVQLRNIRKWGAQDRLLDTGLLEDWKDRVEHGREVLPCEIELWFRKTPDLRRGAAERVSGLVAELGGEVVSQSLIEEIGYQAILAKLPAGAVQAVMEHRFNEVELVQCEQIQFIRATGQAAVAIGDDQQIEDGPVQELPERAGADAVLALFDGLPLQNHQRLAGRLRIDDPAGVEATYQTNERRHGTAMASLILHGDLNANDAELRRPLYVRPLLQPDVRDWQRPRREAAPDGVLFIDLLFTAVRRMFEREGDQAPAAPRVCVINLSIGIVDRPFDSALSPCARLLDWLAWKYKVLFVVSAGNYAGLLELGITAAAFAGLDAAGKQKAVISALAADARSRRLLSPGEAVNVLTIGASHRDATNGNGIVQTFDPFVATSLPSPINAQGMGYRRSIKPEIMMPGGRVVLRNRVDRQPDAVVETYVLTNPPGQRVAAPGGIPGDLTKSWHTRGTSNAAALTTRAAGLLYEVLQELRREPGGELIDRVPRSIWLKAMLVHTARWGEGGAILEGVLKTHQNSSSFKEYITRLIGYGQVDVPRVSECTAYRVTGMSGGALRDDQAHTHRFPLPPSLAAKPGMRRLTVSLAWLTPVNPSHQKWRRAQLWFATKGEPLRLGRMEADWQAVQRGTVQHEVFEGDRAAAFLDDAVCEVQVNCRAEAGALEDEVPYALLITLEVGEAIGIQIYDEVRARVQAARVEIE